MVSIFLVIGILACQLAAPHMTQVCVAGYPSGGADVITVPSSGTVWEQGSSDIRVEWDGVEGALAKLFLFKGSNEVAQLSGWEENDGSFLDWSDVPEEWGSGDGYTVVLEDNLGNVYSSAEFRITSNLVIQDTGLGPWATGQEYAEIGWSGAQGSSVRVVLEKDGVEIAQLCNWDVNTGSYQIPFPIPPEWGTGSGYRVVVEDNLGNSDESRQFQIQPILILSPQAGEHWTVGDPVPSFQWAGAHNVVRIILRRAGEEVAEIARWMDDTGSYTPDGEVPASWAPQRSSTYELIVLDDLGHEGSLYPIRISHTDDTYDGAIPLSRTGSDFIEVAGDTDYWVVEATRGNIYKVTASDTVTVTLQVLSHDGSRSVTGPTVGEVDWQASRTGEYLIKVVSRLGATGPYTLNFGRAFGSIQ